MSGSDSTARLSASSALIGQLTTEVSGLREALRQRAVVEQATGLLAGKLGCGLSTAFEHLNRIAHDTDMAIDEASYLLLGETAPSGLPAPPHEPRSPGLKAATIFSKEAVLRMVEGTRRPATPPIPRQQTADSARPGQLVELARLIPLPAFVLSPVTDVGGDITDFRIDHANEDSRYLRAKNGAPIVGQTLLGMFPEVATSGLFSSYVHAMRGDHVLKLDLFPFQGMVNGNYVTRTVDIRAQRRGGQLLVTWRVYDTAGERARRITDAEQDTDIGWGEWNVYSDEVTWSHEMYGIHGRDLSDGPLAIDAYREIVHPDDVPMIEGLLRGIIERGEDTEVEFRIMPPAGGIRHIRVWAAAITDPAGKLLLLRGVFQDVTERHRTEHELLAAKAIVERARRDATLRMQRTLLPDESRRVDSEGYEIAVRYISAEPGNKACGDWYESRVRRDGSVFLAVGDVAGHGLEAAAGMARISNALRGLSAGSLESDEMLAALNRLICETEDKETVATAITGTLDPGHPVLRWAQAGHPPPVLIRDGAPLLLDRPQGLMLGIWPNAVYATASMELHDGDLLLWYTDGLIEHRRRDISAGISRLLDTAAKCVTETAEDFLGDLSRRLGPLAVGDDVCMLAARVR